MLLTSWYKDFQLENTVRRTLNLIKDQNQNDYPLITFVTLLMLNSKQQEQAKKILDKWNYQTIRKIGKGGFGHVVLASKFTNSMSFYAIKCFSLKNSAKDANFKKYIQQQAKSMRIINHPNVVRFETSFQDGGWYFIVMEYCDMGTLFNYQSKNPHKFLHLQEASKILMQILNAVQAVHRENIIHRDIKSDNIFLKKNKVGSGFRCKLGDFGFAKQIDQITKTACGTTLFMAPEVMKKIPYSYQADVWSIGVVFYLMIFGEYPFKSINIQKQIYDKCVNGFTIQEPPAHLKNKKQFVHIENIFNKIFDLDQNRRIKLNEIRDHKLFNLNTYEKNTIVPPTLPSDESFSDQLEEQLESCLGKVKFIEDLMSDLASLKFLEPYLFHASRFYLFKIMMSILKEQNVVFYRTQQPKHRLCLEIMSKEEALAGYLGKQYQVLFNFTNEIKKIGMFNLGFNLETQNFYTIKEGYRNTLSAVYSQIQKRISQQNMKNQLKLRVLCCHLINRVFSNGFKSEVFPNFCSWQKKNVKGDMKKEMEFAKFKEWILIETNEKLTNQIESINKKFYC